MTATLRRLQRALSMRITQAAAKLSSPFRAVTVGLGGGAADPALYQRRRLTLLFAPLFLAVIVSGVLAVRAFRDLLDDESAVAHARVVHDQVATVDMALADGEVALRTYLLTGDAADRTSYAAKRTVVVAEAVHLQAETANDAPQRDHAARLMPLVQERLAQWQQASDLRAQQRSADAVAVLRSAKSTQTDASIDTLLAQMDVLEDRRIDDRLSAARRRLLQSQGVLIAATGVNILLLAVLLALMWHILAEHERYLRRERAARTQVEAALALRDQFLSVASHELRTPLTILLHSMELLERRVSRTVEADERLRQIFATIHRQLVRLQALIATMLDVSRIERGQLTIAHNPLDLASLVRTVVDEVRPTTHRHTIELIAPSGAIFVGGDAERLSQVLLNLLDNAIKYSPGGGAIRVEMTLAHGWVEVAVTDHGTGIPAEAVPHLFERFYRAPSVRSEHIGGMGVGLYVVGEIVALHGGEVTVTSTEGVGSTFSVRLPIIAPEGSAPDAGCIQEHTRGPQASIGETATGGGSPPLSTGQE